MSWLHWEYASNNMFYSWWYWPWSFVSGGVCWVLTANLLSLPLQWINTLSGGRYSETIQLVGWNLLLSQSHPFPPCAVFITCFTYYYQMLGFAQCPTPWSCRDCPFVMSPLLIAFNQFSRLQTALQSTFIVTSFLRIFEGCIIIHGVAESHFGYPCTSWWAHGLLTLPAALTDAIMKIHVELSCGHASSFLRGPYLEVRGLGHGSSVCNFLRSCQWLRYFPFLPVICKILAPLLTLVIVCLFDSSHPRTCEA
jgi:hypothetical protein